jgi:hypothetical protein
MPRENLRGLVDGGAVDSLVIIETPPHPGMLAPLPAEEEGYAPGAAFVSTGWRGP